MIKDWTWKEYAFFVAVALAGALAVHWGLLNVIAPGPKKLSKAAEKQEATYISMVSAAVYQALSASPAGDPITAGLGVQPAHHG